MSGELTYLMPCHKLSPSVNAETHSKKTTFVDASGNVINYESIKAGEPTTVYYTTVDGQPVVSKVVVRRTVPATVSKTETTETTTTTTSKH